MEELPMKEIIPMKAEQFQCLGCEKKFYINVDDVKEGVIYPCPFCRSTSKNIRQFELDIKKIFIKV